MIHQTPAERAREIAGQIERIRNTEDNHRFATVVEIITAALTIPANHIRTHEGKDVKVLGTLIYTEDGCLCGNGAKVYPLHPLPDYPDDHGRIEFRLVDDASGEQYDESEASPGKCFSSRDAAKAALTSTPTP